MDSTIRPSGICQNDGRIVLMDIQCGNTDHSAYPLAQNLVLDKGHYRALKGELLRRAGNSKNRRKDSKMERDKDAEFTQLAMGFPSLREAAGISPWNPNRLDIWAAGETSDPAAIAAAQFLLASWNPRYDWECGRFEVVAAFKIWDLPHRLQFHEWARRNCREANRPWPPSVS